jgi:5-methyltetrahydropteroyltriglutamate--homocysteine methyltransferase
MERSTKRILTTHTGSLPRSKGLVALMVAVSQRRQVDQATLARAVEEGTRLAVRKQLEAGIDVGNNGEQSRESFVSYVQHRLTGFGGESQRPVPRDIIAFPSFIEMKLPDFSRTAVSLMTAPKAIGPVAYAGAQAIERECADLRRILGEQPSGFVEPFMSAASPGIVAAALLNEHYPSDDAYVLAVAEALRPEYAQIVAQGFVLQVDAPDLAMERHISFADRPLDEFLRRVETNVAALNRALAGLPADRVRLHTCWGNYEAPHHLDVPLAEILPLLYRANVSALVLPFANPRHQHEWRCLERAPLPDGWLLVAGVIDSTTNYVEHPEVVAERIERIAGAVGDPARVLAGTDCGFDTAAGFRSVAEEVVWEKLRSLRAGADLASQRLFR